MQLFWVKKETITEAAESRGKQAGHFAPRARPLQGRMFRFSTFTFFSDRVLYPIEDALQPYFKGILPDEIRAATVMERVIDSGLEEHCLEFSENFGMGNKIGGNYL